MRDRTGQCPRDSPFVFPGTGRLPKEQKGRSVRFCVETHALRRCIATDYDPMLRYMPLDAQFLSSSIVTTAVSFDDSS